MKRALVLQLDPQLAAVAEADSLRKLSLLAQLVEVVRHQPSVTADLVLASLLSVDLLDHHQRNDDVVVLEGEHRIGIVQQDVGVEHVDLLHIASEAVGPAGR